MSVTCPNKSLPEWKTLVNSVGEDLAYTLWDLHKGNVPQYFSYTGLERESRIKEYLDKGKDVLERISKLDQAEQNLRNQYGVLTPEDVIKLAKSSTRAMADKIFSLSKQRPKMELGTSNIYDSTTDTIQFSLSEIKAISESANIPFLEALDIIVAHEIAHRGTVFAITSKDPSLREFQTNLKKAHEQFKRYAKYYGFQDKIRDQMAGEGPEPYQLQLEEFVADFYSNPYFREYLEAIPATGTKSKTNLLDYIKAILNKLFGTNFEMGDTLASEVNRLLDKKIYLKNERARASQIEGIQLGVLGFISPRNGKDAGEVWNDISSLNSGVKIVEDPNTKREDYSLGDKILRRLTEFIQKDFGYTQYTEDDLATKAAERYFEQNKNLINPATNKIEFKDGTSYTFDEFVLYKKESFNQARVYGKALHLIFEKFGNPERTEEINRKINEYKLYLTDFYKSRLNHLDSKEFRESLFQKMAIDPTKNDRIFTEMLIHNEELDLGTRLDGLVYHGNNLFSIYDYKSGQTFGDINTVYQQAFKYAQGRGLEIPLNKVTRAQFEVVWRAFMLKSQLEMNGKIPDVRFRTLAIEAIKVDSFYGNMETSIQEHHVNVDDYLKLIEGWFKEHKPELHGKYKSYFDGANYYGADKTTLSFYESLNPKEREEYLKDSNSAEKLILQVDFEITELEEKRKKAPPEDRKKYDHELIRLKDVRLNLAKLIGAYTTGMDVNRLESTADKDISYLGKVLYNLADYAHPMLQMLNMMWKKVKYKYETAIDKVKEEHDALFHNVVEEYISLHPDKKWLLKAPINSWRGKGLAYYTGKGDGFFDFAYEQTGPKNVEDHTGLKLKSHTDPSLTSAQSKYIEYISKSMKDTYKQVADTVLYTNGNTTHTKAGKMKLSDTLPDGFIPAVPLSQEEFSEWGIRTGQWKEGALPSKEELVARYKGYQEGFIHRDTDTLLRTSGIPVKYLGNKDIRDEQRHSTNLAEGYLRFMQNMHEIQNYEPLIGVFNGVRDWAELKGFKNISGAVERVVLMQLKGIKDMGSKFLKEDDIKYVDENGKIQATNWTKFLELTRKLTIASSMWGAVDNGLINATLIQTINLKNIFLNRVARLKKDDPSYNANELGNSFGDYFKSQGAFTTMKKELVEAALSGNDDKIKQNKLYQFANKLRFIPDNYEWRLGRDTEFRKRTGFDTSWLVFAHTIGEEAGSYGLLHTMLHAKKHPTAKNDKGEPLSLWDCYEVVEKEGTGGVKYHTLQWKSSVPARGKVKVKQKDGSFILEDLKDLSAEEITVFKRNYEILHGPYRQEERPGMELYAEGRIFTQMRKYLKTYLLNAFQKEYTDYARGVYEEKKTNVIDPESGQTREETYLEWRGREVEGRMRILAKSILAVTIYSDNPAIRKTIGNLYKYMTGVEMSPEMFKKLDKYKIKNLSPDKRRELIYASLNVGMFILGITLYTGGVPDDDKDKTYARRLKRFVEDQLEGIHPGDLIRTGATPGIGINKIKLFSETTSLMIWDVISGERTDEGLLHGSKTFKKQVLPFGNMFRMIEMFENEEPFDIFSRPGGGNSFDIRMK